MCGSGGRSPKYLLSTATVVAPTWLQASATNRAYSMGSAPRGGAGSDTKVMPARTAPMTVATHEELFDNTAATGEPPCAAFHAAIDSPRLHISPRVNTSS